MPKNRIAAFGLLTRLFQDLKLLIPLVWAYLQGSYRDVSARSIVIFIVTLAYIVSPIDLLPDYVPGLGQIDDAVLLGAALYLLEKDLLKYREWKETSGREKTAGR